MIEWWPSRPEPPSLHPLYSARVYSCSRRPNSERYACLFDDFFSDTPQELLLLGIYNDIACPLKAGALRAVSLKLLARAIVNCVTRDSPLTRLAESVGATIGELAPALADISTRRMPSFHVRSSAAEHADVSVEIPPPSPAVKKSSTSPLTTSIE